MHNFLPWCCARVFFVVRHVITFFTCSTAQRKPGGRPLLCSLPIAPFSRCALPAACDNWRQLGLLRLASEEEFVRLEPWMLLTYYLVTPRVSCITPTTGNM